MRLAEHDGELLHWFYSEGLVPGSAVEVRNSTAVRPSVVTVDGAERAVGETAAEGLFVRRT